MQMSAREMADGRAALQIRLTSLLAWPAVLHEAPLAFQPGFCLEADLTAAAGMFPLTVCLAAASAIVLTWHRQCPRPL